MLNLKHKHSNLLMYKELVEEIGPINYYNTVVAERKNGLLKRYLISRRNYNCIVTSLGRHVECDEVAKFKEDIFISQVKPMSDAAYDKLSDEIKDLVGDSEPCWRVCVDNVEFRKGQVLHYYPKENVACTNVKLAVVETIIMSAAHDEPSVELLCRRLETEFLEDLNCFKILSREEIVVVAPEQFASHCPSNIIEMGNDVGSVICPKARPICF